ncbi:MAG: ABC transporter ATP-binding protein [Cytophagales bacterium]|nr:ABC transporter ATP-binding protein [Cytophagales bacterium]
MNTGQDPVQENSPANVALRATNVEKIYPTRPDFKALNDVSLSVAAGECFALVGVNGAGKTTLIKSWLNLTQVSRGSLAIFGVDATTLEARTQLAYMPERFAPHGWLKTRDYIQLVLSLHGVAWSEADAVQTLSDMGLQAGVLKLAMRECSKGMSQKIGLAAAFLSKRELLILDEPMSGLDPISRVQVKGLIRRMRELGRTVFMCTHALGDVGELADRLAVMHGGEIRFVGTVPEWLAAHNTDNLELAYLATVQG